MIAPSLSSAAELLLPQDLDWTLVFVSFLSRYPSDTDSQIYSNSGTRPCMILCTASFQICFWISPCVHQCFAHYHAITLFYLQNVDFEGSSKSSFESSCSKYRHYRSDYLLSSIQQSWVTITDYHNDVYSKKCFHFFLGNYEVSSILMSIKVWLFSYQF